jgi:hypothetical protein
MHLGRDALPLGPLGPLGAVARKAFVQPDLNRVLGYRRRAVVRAPEPAIRT